MRAKHTAWAGAALIGGGSGLVGIAALLLPEVWMSLFTQDADVIAAGKTYIYVVAPLYALYGGGLGLFFACQGAGHLWIPMLANILRVGTAAAGGAFAIHILGFGLPGLVSAMATGMVASSAILAIYVYSARW